MPNYTYNCETCESTTIEQFRIADRPETVTCACGGTAKFTIVPVPVMNHSYRDGTKRFQDFREASKLNKEAAVSSDSTKKEIHREIKKMGVSIKKDGLQ